MAAFTKSRCSPISHSCWWVDGSAVFNMIIAQNTHVEDLGINKGIQNNYARIGLISLKKGEGQTYA